MSRAEATADKHLARLLPVARWPTASEAAPTVDPRTRVELLTSEGSIILALDEAQVQTPFWAAFAWDDLRRF